MRLIFNRTYQNIQYIFKGMFVFLCVSLEMALETKAGRRKEMKAGINGAQAARIQGSTDQST